MNFVKGTFSRVTESIGNVITHSLSSHAPLEDSPMHEAASSETVSPDSRSTRNRKDIQGPRVKASRSNANWKLNLEKLHEGTGKYDAIEVGVLHVTGLPCCID